MLQCQYRVAVFRLVYRYVSAAMEIAQQPLRVTLQSELANQSRRIFLDGRDFLEDFPTQCVGYSIGHSEGSTLVIETRLATVVYRRQEDGVMFEDDCAEGIWMEALERMADEAE